MYEFVIDFTLLFNHHKTFIVCAQREKLNKAKEERKRRKRGVRRLYKLTWPTLLGSWPGARAAKYLTQWLVPLTHTFTHTRTHTKGFYCASALTASIAALGTLENETEMATSRVKREGVGESGKKREGNIGVKAHSQWLLKLGDRLQSSPSSSPSLVCYIRYLFCGYNTQYTRLFIIFYCIYKKIFNKNSKKTKKKKQTTKETKQSRAKFSGFFFLLLSRW